MQPTKAISISVLGTFLLVVILSSFTNTGGDTAPHGVCSVVQESMRLCRLPVQDRTKTVAVDHAARGYGMAKAVRELFTDEAIAKRCSVNMYDVDRLCQQVRLRAMETPQKIKVA